MHARIGAVSSPPRIRPQVDDGHTRFLNSEDPRHDAGTELRLYLMQQTLMNGRYGSYVNSATESVCFGFEEHQNTIGAYYAQPKDAAGRVL